MDIQNCIPRPSLLWLSREQVTYVRNRMLQLYISPSDEYAVAPPADIFGIGKVIITSGVTPCFYFRKNDVFHWLWLKCAGGKNPYFDYTYTQDKIEKDYEAIAFNDKRAEVAAKLIKSYARHFPFAPTNNFLRNNGEFIA